MSQAGRFPSHPGMVLWCDQCRQKVLLQYTCREQGGSTKQNLTDNFPQPKNISCQMIDQGRVVLISIEPKPTKARQLIVNVHFSLISRSQVSQWCYNTTRYLIFQNDNDVVSKWHIVQGGISERQIRIENVNLVF